MNESNTLPAANDTTNGNHTNNNKKGRDGVADYFAILGVGETLVWKHAQKSRTADYHEGDPNHSTATTTITSPASAAAEEEDEAALMERFYREIVEVAIVITKSSSGNHGDSNSIHRHQHHHRLGGGIGSAANASFATDDSASISSSQANHPAATVASTATSTARFSHIVTSPSQYSDATTAYQTLADSTVPTTTATTNTTTAYYDAHHRQATAAAAQLDGFTVLTQTFPASRGSATTPTTTTTTTTKADSSISSTLADESAVMRTTTSEMDYTWKKFQVFDANLDPILGLRAELASMTNPSATASDSTTPNNHHNNNSSTSTNGGSNNNHTYDGSSSSSLKGLRRKVGSTLRNQLLGLERRRGGGSDRRPDFPQQQRQPQHVTSSYPPSTKFYLAYRRRAPDESYRPAVADMSLHYIKLHKSTICSPKSLRLDSQQQQQQQGSNVVNKQKQQGGSSSISSRVTDLSRLKYMEKYSNRYDAQSAAASGAPEAWWRENSVVVPLTELVAPPPSGYDSWVIPDEFRYVRQPDLDPKAIRKPPVVRMTYIVPHRGPEVADDATASSTGTSGIGVEAFVDRNSLLSPPTSPTGAMDPNHFLRIRDQGLSPRSASEISVSVADAHEPVTTATWDRDMYRPKLLAADSIPLDLELLEDYMFIPVLAIRRQRVGDEERYHEDPAIVDMSVMFSDQDGNVVLPSDDPDHNTNGDDEEDEFSLLSKSPWVTANKPIQRKQHPSSLQALPNSSSNKGGPTILVRRNIPVGFADAAFATRVLDRFPFSNYKGLPLPAEELPMFCYPTGCRLFRARFSDAPLPQYYGFVLKNERGDSIYVSCVSFMEKLTASKVEQLAVMSEKRSRTSIPHMLFCDKRRGPRHRSAVHSSSHHSRTESMESEMQYRSLSDTISTDSGDATFLLTGFDEMTTFENKTICLISRYPFWTAFRRFLSHLHILSGSSSDIPLERCISHLLLTVPLPKAGGPNIIVPLPALNSPMVLSRPAEKDLPLVDLPFQRLLACLDVSAMVTIVLGFLVLERKVIVMSTRPALVLDVCELLRSLMFPFDLCAPYVPRLTEPFMSCLDFPGAIFVGIHDDGSSDGLAAIVRESPPEESAIVDLDMGRIDCSGDRANTLQQSWGIIPAGPRSAIVAEIDCLCRDAGIVPGQEPLDSQVDPAFDAAAPSGLVEYFDDPGHRVREPLDDRAVRDSFLRFFCAILGGYERFLVVPDVDFLISGNEWFDTEGFLATASQEKAPYLRMLVSTQLFQSFIQRRTEASDMRCLLFDECLSEFHSSPVAYGRLGGDVETITSNETGQPQMIYSLLVDQSASEPSTQMSDDQMGSFFESRGEKESKICDSDTDSSAIGLGIKASKSVLDLSERMQNDQSLKYSESCFNEVGDLVTAPSKIDLPEGRRFVYCVDGAPCFPHKLSPDMYLPSEPESWLLEMSTIPSPTLSRSDREIEEANRRRKMATSYRGMHNQRRCLWQLPKLMGSHFLGSWLLCIPSQVSQPHLSHDQQAKYLLRALGALRLLRNKQRIVPDEAAYRALMVACGRSESDRRVELVKLFGLLRSDGIFPSAVTLGQYTRALAEGYSKRSTGLPEEDYVGGVEVTESASRDGRIGFSRNGPSDVEALNTLDSNVANLEESGRRWRQRYSVEKDGLRPPNPGEGVAEDSVSVGTKEHHTQETVGRQRKRGHNRSWLPVVFSSSFVPRAASEKPSFPPDSDSIRLVALWSRTRSCNGCSYIPLEEEVQSGWDVVGGENEIPGSICCPRCGSLMIPMLGYKEVSLKEALSPGFYDSSKTTSREQPPDWKAFEGLPPQITPFIDPPSSDDGRSSFVTYVSPVTLRVALERQVEKGEGSLDRDSLKEQDPELFYNFWWYCARFSLPLPLPVDVSKKPKHYLAFAAWDRSVAERACWTAARALSFLFNFKQEKQNGSQDDAPQDLGVSSADSFDEYPLLSRFNLQALCQADWDHQDLSAILVGLVEACEGKRDFRPVLETMLRSNRKRRASYSHNSIDSGSDVASSICRPESSAGIQVALIPSAELDCYRTILYLAKYQCTSAFHVFFPTIAKPCKGYHFWCAIGTPLPIFDRLLRDAMKRVRAKENTSYTPMQEASDVALGFRCVFGHLI